MQSLGQTHMEALKNHWPAKVQPYLEGLEGADIAW